jgi:hypothetical protein
VPGPNIDTQFVSEGLGRAPYQFPDVVDNLADKVGYASGGIGDIFPSFKGNDLKIGPVTAGLGGRAHSGGITSDDNKALSWHSGMPP